ncbi:proline-rich receptor-like protein kinase PERK2 [Oryza sativa Japonica Group]|uniref:proline-rich receptor-like protein kinase PERK2 n=1 Tax=Oryza sativa subsp. japonica TaxID=39947 RepID=UPI00339C7658
MAAEPPTSPPLPARLPIPARVWARSTPRHPLPPPFPPLLPSKTGAKLPPLAHVAGTHPAGRCRPNPPRPGSLSPSRAYKRDPRAPLLRFPLLPEPVAPSPAFPTRSPANSSRAAPPLPFTPHCGVALPGTAAAVRTPSTAPFPLPTFETPPPRSPSLSTTIAASSRAASPLWSTSRCAVAFPSTAAIVRSAASTPSPSSTPEVLLPPCIPSHLHRRLSRRRVALSSPLASQRRVAPRSPLFIAGNPPERGISRSPVLPALSRGSAVVGRRRNTVPVASRADHRHPFRRRSPPRGRLAVAALACRIRRFRSPQSRGKEFGRLF